MIDTLDVQDYGFEYSDDGGEEDSGSADVENMYYKAKGMQIDIIMMASSLMNGEMSYRKEGGRSGGRPEGV
jgi:hypothetical protein